MTSIEWLKEKLWNEFNFSFSDNIFEQAKEIHKQEIIDAYDSGYDSSGESGKEYYEWLIEK